MELFDIIGRYNLAKETSLILGAVGVALAILGIIISLFSKTRKGPIIIFCVVISLGSIALLWNYYSVIYDDEIQIVNVPNVERLTYGSAQTIMRVFGLVERPVSTDGQIASAEQIVLKQEPSGNSAVPAGSEVILLLGTSGSDGSGGGDGSDSQIPTEPERPSETEDSASRESLSLSIDFIEETDSYYYEYPDPQNPNITLFISFGRGLSGAFSYSRPLTEAERTNWYHGGKIYNENGLEVGEDGNWPSFWSDPDGIFAVEFPRNLPAGRYTYELYQIIGGQMISDTIEFFVQ